MTKMLPRIIQAFVLKTLASFKESGLFYEKDERAYF